MDANINFETQCPKCAAQLVQQSPRPDLQSQLTCVSCGHTDQFDKFLSPDSVSSQLEAIAEALRQKYKDIPGFK